MTIEERLEKVERELGRARRFNRCMFAVVGLAAVTWLLLWSIHSGGSDNRTVRAREFIVEDEKRQTRIRLLVDTFGSRLSLYDEKGKSRAGLFMDELGPRLSLLDENTTGCARLFMDKLGPRLRMLDENGVGRAELAVIKDGPCLRLADENGTVTWKAP